MVAAIAGSFIGLVLGGVLAPVAWRLVFLVSVPFGLFGTVWAYLKLEDRGIRTPAKIDWWGNVTFGLGLIAVLVGITYGILPYGGHNMGWTAPRVIASLLGGFAMMGLFVVIERRVEAPFATGGMIASAIGFPLLIALPIDFTYWEFGLVIYLLAPRWACSPRPT